MEHTVAELRGTCGMGWQPIDPVAMQIPEKIFLRIISYRSDALLAEEQRSLSGTTIKVEPRKVKQEQGLYIIRAGKRIDPATDLDGVCECDCASCKGGDCMGCTDDACTDPDCLENQRAAMLARLKHGLEYPVLS